MVAIVLWGQRPCYLCKHIDESHVHLLLQCQGGGKRVWQMSCNLFQALGNTLRQLPLSTLSLLRSDQEPCLAPVALCLHIQAPAWEMHVNVVFILCMGSSQTFVTSRHHFTAAAVNAGRKRWKNASLSHVRSCQASEEQSWILKPSSFLTITSLKKTNVCRFINTFWVLIHSSNSSVSAG